MSGVHQQIPWQVTCGEARWRLYVLWEVMRMVAAWPWRVFVFGVLKQSYQYGFDGRREPLRWRLSLAHTMAWRPAMFWLDLNREWREVLRVRESPPASMEAKP